MTEGTHITSARSTHIPLPAVAETVVGAGFVQTTNARDLHRFLEVGRDFSNWIKARLDKYGFVENVDFVREGVSAKSGENLGGRPLTEYHLTLDTAKEIAMVENNEQGRAARRYFIDCERRARVALDAQTSGGITKGVIRKAINDIVPDLLNEALVIVLPALVREQIISQQHAVIQGVSAGQVLDMAGIRDRKGLRGLARRVSDILRRYHAERGVTVKAGSLGSATAYVFDSATARAWLADGGKQTIERIVSEKRGQAVLRLN